MAVSSAISCLSMYQRYVLPDIVAAEREFVPLVAWWKFAARFNVAAQQYVPAIRMHAGQSEGVMLRWGLIPSWAEGQPPAPPKVCVSSERIERSRSYRLSWLNGQRCILPMAGFYAWQLTRAGYRQPYYLRLIDRSVFGVAALWDRWVSDDDDVIESCALIRVPENDFMRTLFGAERGMPAILRRRHYRAWLQGDPIEAQEALQPYDAKWMDAYPVSPRINSTAVDDPALIQPTATLEL